MISLFRIFCVALFLPLSSFAAEVSWIPFQGTESPDGRYVIAWGISEYTRFDDSDPDALFEKLDLDAVRNFIVDVKEGYIVKALPSRYFSLQGRAENHGSLDVKWRSDSKAVAVVYGGKWEPREIFVSYFTGISGNDFDTYDLLGSLSKAARTRIASRLPAPDFGVVSFSDLTWKTDDSIAVTFEIYQPKGEEEGVGGALTFRPPSPASLIVE
ncbi:MAG: hypothetical protein P1U89_12860 [Verrucomicrobiales bacterium]|nr:hypothetical protein [Verrucomicrobiales bacterium]